MRMSDWRSDVGSSDLDRTHDRAKAALAPRNIANGGAIPLNKIAPITEALGKPHLRGCARSLRSVAALLKADLYRYAGKTDAKSFWKHRSEEHTSELQSLMRISYAVFCLQKKKQPSTDKHNRSTTNTTN